MLLGMFTTWDQTSRSMDGWTGFSRDHMNPLILQRPNKPYQPYPVTLILRGPWWDMAKLGVSKFVLLQIHLVVVSNLVDEVPLVAQDISINRHSDSESQNMFKLAQHVLHVALLVPRFEKTCPQITTTWSSLEKKRVAKSVLSISYEPLAVEKNRTSVQGEIRFSVQNFHSCPHRTSHKPSHLWGGYSMLHQGFDTDGHIPKILPSLHRSPAPWSQNKMNQWSWDDPPHLSLKLYNKQTAAIQAVLFHNLQPQKKTEKLLFANKVFCWLFWDASPTPSYPTKMLNVLPASFATKFGSRSTFSGLFWS